MREAIVNLLPLVLVIVIMVIWVRALADSDGMCHYEDCEGCPYSGICDEQERKEGRRETDGCEFDQHG